MAGHAQLKFVMTECSKTQIRLTGLRYCLKDPFAIGDLTPVIFEKPRLLPQKNFQGYFQVLGQMINWYLLHLFPCLVVVLSLVA